MGKQRHPGYREHGLGQVREEAVVRRGQPGRVRGEQQREQGQEVRLWPDHVAGYLARSYSEGEKVTKALCWNREVTRAEAVMG